MPMPIGRRALLGAGLGVVASRLVPSGASARDGLQAGVAQRLQAMVDGPVIDVHAHMVPPGWFGPTGRPVPDYSIADLAGQLARFPYAPVDDAAGIAKRDFDRLMRFEKARFDGTIEATAAVLIEEMDTAGIDIAVNNLMDEVHQPFRRKMIVPVEQTMADCARIAADYPDRIVNFFGVDPRRGPDGIKLLRRAVEEFGFAGMGEWLTDSWNIFANDRKLAYPFLEACADLAIPFGNNGSGVHPSVGPDIFQDIVRDFPTLKIVHQAAGLLTDKERAAHPDLIDKPYRLLAIAERHPNFYLDIDDWQRLDDAGMMRTFAFVRRALDGPAASRIMFGTDFPVFTRPVPASVFAGSFLDHAPRLGFAFTAAEMTRLFSANALAFLDGPHAPKFIKAAAQG